MILFYLKMKIFQKPNRNGFFLILATRNRNRPTLTKWAILFSGGREFRRRVDSYVKVDFELNVTEFDTICEVLSKKPTFSNIWGG